MKLTKIIYACGAVVVMVTLAISCTKRVDKEIGTENTDFTDKAFIQVYNATLNAARNYVYVDGNAVTGAAVAFGATFPSTPSNFNTTDGYRIFLIKDTLSTSTQVPMSFAENLQAGKYYTIFMYDTLNSPKQKIVQNNISIPADSTARVRLANFIFTKTAVPNIDVFSIKRNANVWTNVNITDVTDYTPYASSLNDTLLVRETGTTNLLFQLNGFNPVRKRSYTLVFRGRYQTTSGTVARTLSSFSSN